MSRVAIDLAPDGLNLLPPPHGLVTVPGRALQSLRPQASIDVSLRLVAAAGVFVKEALSVAFVENLHDFFAACGAGGGWKEDFNASRVQKEGTEGVGEGGRGWCVCVVKRVEDG